MLKVYYLKLSDYKEYPDAFFASLVCGERWEEAQRCADGGVRRTRLLGEAMVRRVLCRTWKERAEGCRIFRGEHGKPYINIGVDAFFNLSHSGDYIVCAVSDAEVGIDIERRGRVREGVARRFFHPGEVERLGRAGERQAQLFFDYWAVKESYLKYLGTGLSGSLSSFEVRFGAEVAVLKENSRMPVGIRECMIDSGYSCFVCGSCPEVVDVEPFAF